jgi:ABC-2 type transport system ATP-binding protein
MKALRPEPVAIRGLHKTYPNGTRAVAGIDLDVAPGEVFGLIGPNGAGKSTLLKLVSGLLRPDQGSVRCGNSEVAGDPRTAAHFVGLMPDPLGVYTDLSAAEYLEFFARLLELPRDEAGTRIRDVVDILELGPWLDYEVETLSAGWQRRLALGRILLCHTPVLLLDEPAAGLDVAARSELLALVRKLAGQDRTIIISSHILPELEQLADRFGIMHKGKWIPIRPDSPFFTRAELAHGLGEASWLLACAAPDRALSLIRGLDAVTHAEPGEQGITFHARDKEAASAALAAVVGAGIAVYRFEPRRTELNAFVLKTLTGESEAP